MIVDLISADLALRKKGRDYWAPCPFHAEKTASFSVSEKGFYHCFGCGAHGDAIDWLRKHRGLSYKEACERIGKPMEPDPHHTRRRVIKAQYEYDYWQWRRDKWAALLDLSSELDTDIALYESFYRSALRAPDLWDDAAFRDVQEALTEYYHRRDVVHHGLDLLQPHTRDITTEEWWMEERSY